MTNSDDFLNPYFVALQIRMARVTFTYFHIV